MKLPFLKSFTSQTKLADSVVLSPSLTHTLRVISDMFGQRWGDFVASELDAVIKSGQTCEGAPLKHMLTSLFANRFRDDARGLSQFMLMDGQIIYRSLDNRYMISIRSTVEPNKVQVIWQLKGKGMGVNSILFYVTDRGWEFQEEMISTEAVADPCGFVKLGGEVLGYFGQHQLTPEKSFVARSIVRNNEQLAAQREAAMMKRAI